jgi:hypothetical protein
LPREILSGGPIITADPSCRVKYYFCRANFIAFVRGMIRPWILFPCAYFCTAEEFSSFFLLPRHFFVIHLFYRIPFLLPRNMCCRAVFLNFVAWN